MLFLWFRVITGQNHFARHKDEQDDAGLHHAVDEAWKQLWLIAVGMKTDQLHLKKVFPLLMFTIIHINRRTFI